MYNNDLTKKPVAISILSNNENYVVNHVAIGDYDEFRNTIYVDIAFKVIQPTKYTHILPNSVPSGGTARLLYTNFDGSVMIRGIISGRNINIDRNDNLPVGEYTLTGRIYF